jgi:DNA-binding GntR family transcriptional regulator
MVVVQEEENASVGERAYERIRTDIIFCHLKPGQQLKLESLKVRYGTGISTLREILARLSAEGLVIAEGQKGFCVAPVSAKDLRETAELRLLLECHAIDQSFAVGDLEWECNVAAAYHMLSQMELKLAKGNISRTSDWKRCDWEFHQSLIAACGSPVLMQTHGAVFDKYIRYQMTALSNRGDIAANEHRTLFECALSRDVDTARATLERHVMGGVEHALRTGVIG